MTSVHEISAELNELRKITVCNECGCRLFRIGGNTRSEKWDCRNSECSRFEYRLTDSMLIGDISAILNRACSQTLSKEQATSWLTPDTPDSDSDALAG